MDAPATVRNPAWLDRSAPVVRQLILATGITFAALLALAALVLLERRVAGALHYPLHALLLATLGAVLAVSAIAFRYLAHRPGERTTPRAFAIHAAPTLVLTFLAIGLLVPGTSLTAWTSFLGVLLIEEGWSWGRLFPPASAPRGPRRESPSPASIDPHPSIATLDERLASHAALLDDHDPGENATDEHATQWLMRRRDPDAGEVIEGWVKCSFETGQRHATAHLAICPPLAATPVCYAEASDGLAQVKVSQVLPHGVRLEIKLDQAAHEACEVRVEFSIQAQAAQ